MPTLVIRSPDGSEREQDVATQLTVGRAEGNDLILTEGGVSRKHARFFVEGPALKVEDVGSANGTFVDGQKIGGPTAVGQKSQVVIGDYEIAVKLGSKPRAQAAAAPQRGSARPTTALPKQPPAGPRATTAIPRISVPPGGGGAALAKRAKPTGTASGPQLRGLTGATTGKSFPVKGTLLVGRVAGVDLQLDDDSVSRRHAEVEQKGKDVVVRDLGSANGTSVNGAAISEDTTLADGDIVQFGVVELMFESGAPAKAAGASAIAPKRNGASGPPARGAGGPPPRRKGGLDLGDDDPGLPLPMDEAAPMDPKKKRLILIGAGGGGLMLLMLIVYALTRPPDVKLDPVPLGGGKTLPGKSSGGKKPKKDVDPTTDIDEALAICRSYASAEAGEPDWEKADETCRHVLDLDPLNQEANDLLKKVVVEKAAQQNYAKAKELVASNRLEDAIELLGKIKPDSTAYFLNALADAKGPVAEVKKKVGGECKNYASNGKWEFALKRCELYAKLACQTMKPEGYSPPPMTTVKLDGFLGKNDWRPSDPLVTNFLKARNRLKPGDPPWNCPEIPAFRPPPPPPDRSTLFKKEVRDRYSKVDPGFIEAIFNYFDGHFPEAPIPLQKIKENVNKVQYHEQADRLLLDVTNAISNYQTGLTEIANDKPEKALEPFNKALALDEKLVLAEKANGLSPDFKKRELEKRTSFLRRGVADAMPAKCYEKGKGAADRKDFKQACALWKMGMTFSRAHNDLLKASYFCTQKAQKMLDNASTCDELEQVLEYAVDGDKIKEDVEQKKIEGGCQ